MLTQILKIKLETHHFTKLWEKILKKLSEYQFYFPFLFHFFSHTMKSLCEAGADANIKNNKNLSSMHMARTQGIKDLIKKIASSYNFQQ